MVPFFFVNVLHMKILLVLPLFLSFSLFARTFDQIEVDPDKELNRLRLTADKDLDYKITIEDKPRPYRVRDKEGKRYLVEGHYHLSNLLQELKLLSESQKTTLKGEQVFENPVERISRSIRERYWDGLTRRIDKKHLGKVLADPKVDTGGVGYLYVPAGDKIGLEYYGKIDKELKKLNLQVVKLPKDITPQYVDSLDGKHGLLSLGLQKNAKGEWEGIPYVVPGGRFNEMYGWDSYFEALGLLVDGRVDLAKAMVDNFVYQINHYGKILNANRTYYLTRSQPPFLTSMIRAVYEELPKSEQTKKWLELSLKAAVKEYQKVWMGEERLTNSGLSRYYGYGIGIPPEVEEGHYRPILAPFAKKHKLSVEEFEKKYDAGKIKEPELDEFFLHDRAVRESGHDTTYRWRVEDKDKCADFVTVDLNSLLYKAELDLAVLIKNELNDKFEPKSAYFLEQAKKRKQLIRTFLWDEKQNMFFDYNVKNKKRSQYISATTLYPLWAHEPSLPDYHLVSKEEAEKLKTAALEHLEAPGGVYATALKSLKLFGDIKHERQWDYPNGWAPHQMMIWRGLKNYGLDEDANRLTYKWLHMITKNAADYNATVPEKYDVLKKSHAVFAEYGNVGTEFNYITREGFGWMNASYQVGLKELPPVMRPMLEKLVPFEELKK